MLTEFHQSCELRQNKTENKEYKRKLMKVKLEMEMSNVNGKIFD